jgi:hypothetical protein
MKPHTVTWGALQMFSMGKWNRPKNLAEKFKSIWFSIKSKSSKIYSIKSTIFDFFENLIFI